MGEHICQHCWRNMQIQSKSFWNQCNISRDFPGDNVKKTGLYRYVYDLSVDYDTIGVDDILDIHKYLMSKHDTK